MCSTALCAENIKAAFRHTGIFPFDPEAVPVEYLKPAEVFQYEPRPMDSQETVEGGIIASSSSLPIDEKGDHVDNVCVLDDMFSVVLK